MSATHRRSGIDRRSVVAALLGSCAASVARAQTARQCGCQYSPHVLSTAPDGNLCWLNESRDRMCRLDWLPPETPRVAEPFGVRYGEAETRLLMLESARTGGIGPFGTTPPSPRVAFLGNDTFWSMLEREAARHSGNPGLSGRALAMFLNRREEEVVRQDEFAIGAALFLVAGGLTRTTEMRDHVLRLTRALIERADDLWNFVGRGSGRDARQPINAAAGLGEGAYTLVAPGWMEVSAPTLGISALVATGWSARVRAPRG